jgi:hypothetical protein
MTRVATAKSLAAAAACGIFMISDASALSCKGFLHAARASMGDDVAALRRVEHEAADRLKGLDTRPFEVLRDEARKTTAVIGHPDILKLEESLKRCRNWTQPVHKICADAGQMLAEILDKHVAAPKPGYDQAAYAAAIGECERLMGVKPLASAIRGTE